VLASALAEGLDEFQAPLGRLVQVHPAAALDPLDAADVAEVRPLGLLEVVDDGAGGREALADVRHAEPLERVGAEVLRQESLGLAAVEHEGGPLADRGAGGLADDAEEVGLGLLGALGKEALAGAQAHEFVRDGVARQVADPEPAGRQVHPRQAGPLAVQVDGCEIVVLLVLQQRVVGQRAGRDDAGDVAPDQALGLGGVLHLLADGHAVPRPNHLGQVGVDGVIRHAAHGHGTGAPGSAGQGDAHDTGPDAGVLVEEFVEVAHPEEQDGVRVRVFELPVLFHRRRGHGTILTIPARRMALPSHLVGEGEGEGDIPYEDIHPHHIPLPSRERV